MMSVGFALLKGERSQIIPTLSVKLFRLSLDVGDDTVSLLPINSSRTSILLESFSFNVYLTHITSCLETLRLYPPATSLIRECMQDYKLPGSDYTIEKGVQVVIPVCGIHRDSQYYPYATEFNPENFSEEAKAKRGRSAYSPFGDGPRVCLGLSLIHISEPTRPY